MPFATGSRLGVYTILDPLRAGGMGEVYRALDTRLGREVAIKGLPEAFSRDAARLARFEREARMLAALNHPSVAAIYGIEEADGTQFIVMELVTGETLSEKISRQAVPLPDTLRIGRQIAEALEAAHERGIIHRDLKPANIKVTPEGRVKVLDLGLAKAFDTKGTGSEPDASLSPTLVIEGTQPGVILGTAEFMSPEQARGKPVGKPPSRPVLLEVVPPPPARRGRLAAIVALSALVALALAWALVRQRRGSSAPPPALSNSLAVLPFRNLSGQGEGQLIGDGLVATVSARLVGLPGLQVVTPSAVVEASDRDSQIQTIARRLGANLILRGTFQRQGDRI